MSLRFALSLTSMILVNTLFAQDFDADSIYYTPITKAAAVVETPKRVSTRDTTSSHQLVSYFFQANIGPLIGCDNCINGRELTFSASTVHGVTIGRKLRTGIGAGFDSYTAWQTLPLFGSVSYDLLGNRNTHAVFVQAQAGWSFAWHDPQPMEYNLVDYRGGRMTELQFGYRFRYHDLRLAWLFGWKKQLVSTYFEYPTWFTNERGETVQGEPITSTVEREMARFMLTFSIGWR